MSDERIYFKTAAGEAAVRERTRLVQRNLRTVLILVDGLADVGTLKAKAGDAVMVDAAIIELEAMGLIHIRDCDQAVETGVAPPLTFEIADPPPTGAWTTSGPAPHVEAHADATRPPGSASSGWWSNLRQRRREAREDAIYEKAYGGSFDSSADASPAPEPAPEAVPAPAPVAARPRSKRGRMRNLLLTAGLVALVLGILRVVFYPYDEHKPRFEQALSEALGEKVSIGNLRVGFLPMPIVMLEKVSVGDTPFHATAEMVRLSPELASLFSAHRYRKVSIQGMKLSSAGLGRVARWFASQGAGHLAVDQLDIETLWFIAGGHAFGPLAGAARIDPGRGLGQVSLGDAGPVRLEALPTPTGWSVAWSASDWPSPFVPPLRFSALEIKGELDDGRFAISKLEGLAYDGQVSGLGEADWRDGVSLSLNLDLRHVAAARLLDALQAPPLLDGNANAKLNVTSRADRFARLGEQLRADGSFALDRGQIKRLDFAEALRLAAQRPPGVGRGGTTGFEELEGRLSSDGRSIRLNGLRMASGLMQASGSAVLSRGAEPSISGNLNVAISGGAGVRGALTISGSADDPELTASR